MRKMELPDFKRLVKQFKEELTNGQRAELRRVTVPSELALLPAFFHLVRPFGKANDAWYRLAFFLPYVDHRDDGLTLGKVLASKKINERRLFQIVRSQPPTDLVHLRRLTQQIKPTVDWNKFGKMIYFWREDRCEISKQQLMKDYYLG